MRRLATFVLILIGAAPALAARHAAGPPSQGTTPRIAVIIAVDGLSWDKLSSWRPWFHAGLARLLDEGAVASECRYAHLNTVTGPGHASLATGAPPRVHGIPLNEWFVHDTARSAMEDVYCATQPPAGRPEGASSVPGPGRLRVATLGDRLVQRDARAKVVAISNKDRAAILLAGRDARHAAYWYSELDGTYVTGPAYDPASPAGAAAARAVARFNHDKAGANLSARFGTAWSRLPVPGSVPAAGFESGLAAYQEAYVGPSFPHDLTKAKGPLPAAILSSAFADRLLTDLALDLLADDGLALGRDDAPDILAVSYSANDYVSHDYGPESVESLEVLRGLDVELGRFLDELSRRFRAGGVLVALSSDHGFLPLPEATKRRDPNAPGGRFSRTKILDQLNAAVDAKLGRTAGAPLIFRFESSSLWLDRVVLARPGAPDPKRVLEIVRDELATTWRDAIAQSIVEDGAFAGGGLGDLARDARNAYVPGRSGDLFVLPRYGVLLSSTDVGTSHGSPWEYDTHVPLIFWGGGIKPRTVSIATTPYDLAPTLASWLHVELPDATGTRLPLWK
jgi:predicted AlkP superfamily pyrophosphatase or phosphodiesterase